MFVTININLVQSPFFKAISLECSPVIISHKGKVAVVSSHSLAPLFNTTGLIMLSWLPLLQGCSPANN